MTTPSVMVDELPAPPAAMDGDAIALITALLDGTELDAAVRERIQSSAAMAAREQAAAEQRADDWPALNRYRAANAAQASPPDLVMIGDSLTELWALATPELFGARVVNRGISGQTSAQLLLRFMPDVVDLAPARVHILCGTNDIGGNTGPSLPIDYERNVRAMVTLARVARIEVLLASIPPAATFPWRTNARPLVFIPRLNAWLRDLAVSEGAPFVDYHARLHDGAGGLRPEYSADGVHVTRAAYRTMLSELICVLGEEGKRP